MIIGNAKTAETFAREFPAASLLFGPRSVGKWTLAETVRRLKGIQEPDVLRVRKLTMSSAREIKQFAGVAPSQSQGRIVIVEVDGASDDAFSALLKTLEESSLLVHFVLIASRPLPETVEGRAQWYWFSLLSDTEVSMVLQKTRGIPQATADRAAAAAGGQVYRALSFLTDADTKADVLSALRAVRDRSEEGLSSLADRWRDEHTEMLVQACTEAVSRRWRLFSDNEIGDLKHSTLLRILMASRLDVRPRLLLRSSLMDLIKETA